MEGSPRQIASAKLFIVQLSLFKKIKYKEETESTNRKPGIAFFYGNLTLSTARLVNLGRKHGLLEIVMDHLGIHAEKKKKRK